MLPLLVSSPRASRSSSFNSRKKSNRATTTQLPTGGRKIDLTFEDPAYKQGKIITILALILTAVLIAGGIFTERRTVA